MRHRNALLLATLLASPAQFAHAETWNLNSAFIVGNGNPAGPWSYGWYTTNFASFTLHPNSTRGSSPGWFGGLGGDGTPCIWHNLTGQESYGIPNGSLSVHPGPGGEASVARWTAPQGVNGIVEVNGAFGSGDIGSPTVAVRHQGAIVWSSPDNGAFELIIDVHPGETIEFEVYGNYAYCNTAITATIRTHCPADLNGDGQVGGADLGALLGVWGPAGANSAADFDNSGDVDGADLGSLLGAWGPCPG